MGGGRKEAEGGAPRGASTDGAAPRTPLRGPRSPAVDPSDGPYCADRLRRCLGIQSAAPTSTARTPAPRAKPGNEEDSGCRALLRVGVGVVGVAVGHGLCGGGRGHLRADWAAPRRRPRPPRRRPRPGPCPALVPRVVVDRADQAGVLGDVAAGRQRLVAGRALGQADAARPCRPAAPGAPGHRPRTRSRSRPPPGPVRRPGQPRSGRGTGRRTPAGCPGSAWGSPG